MQSDEKKELLRKLRDFQNENEYLRNENKKLQTILGSFSIKPASSLQTTENLFSTSFHQRRKLSTI